MKVVSILKNLRDDIAVAVREGKKIGFVPTMGFLHAGHLSLVKKAREETDVVVMSIFVNPLQFAPGEDLEKYPWNPERDAQLASQEGVDIIFYPENEDIYPPSFSTYVNVEGLTENLCGKFRPGHFRGVTTIVAKLFNMVQPDIAYFGQKDAQQALVIRRMVMDLNMPLEVKILPTVREKDGLAMSSRNTYLSVRERSVAPLIYKSLLAAEKAIKEGERDKKAIITAMLLLLRSEEIIKIEYLEIVDTGSLTPVNTLAGEVLIALAVKIGKTRLIDNVLVIK